jgi:hypothetical protein
METIAHIKNNLIARNKEFIETNYPLSRAIKVFRSFHFDLKRSKTKILLF